MYAFRCASPLGAGPADWLRGGIDTEGSWRANPTTIQYNTIQGEGGGAVTRRYLRSNLLLEQVINQKSDSFSESAEQIENKMI